MQFLIEDIQSGASDSAFPFDALLLACDTWSSKGLEEFFSMVQVQPPRGIRGESSIWATFRNKRGKGAIKMGKNSTNFTQRGKPVWRHQSELQGVADVVWKDGTPESVVYWLWDQRSCSTSRSLCPLTCEVWIKLSQDSCEDDSKFQHVKP